MPFDGSGNFARAHRWVSDQRAGTNITASRKDEEDDNFAAGLSNVMCRDGQSTILADIPFNNHRAAAIGNAAAATDAANQQSGDARWAMQAGIGITAPFGVVQTVAAATVDCQTALYFTKTVSGPLTWTFANPPPAGRLFGFVLQLTNGGAGAQTWPASVTWDGNGAPYLQPAGVDVLLFTTANAGTTWRGRKIHAASS